jgi:hypothetical protein
MTEPTREELAKTIESSYEGDFLHPFPSEELAKLKPIDPERWELLQVYLELFIADIAGWCSQASRLMQKPERELARVHRSTLLPFFERYPDLQVFQQAITQESTPELFESMAIVELRRQQLFSLVQPDDTAN